MKQKKCLAFLNFLKINLLSVQSELIIVNFKNIHQSVNDKLLMLKQPK